MNIDAQYETMLVTRRGPIVEVQLNRPEVRNALNAKFDAEWNDVLEAAETDPEIRVVTFTAIGPAFCAGRDLKEVGEGVANKTPRWEVLGRQAPHLPRAWYFSKGLVAGVHGYIGAAALHLLGPMDFIVAAADSRFSFEQARAATAGRDTILAFQIPMRMMKKLYLMGGWFDADTALQFQFVQRVVPTAEDVRVEVAAWADELAKMHERQIAVAKESIHRAYELMGLLNVMGVQNRVTSHGNDHDQNFFDNVQEMGLREAVRVRDSQFDRDIAKV